MTGIDLITGYDMLAFLSRLLVFLVIGPLLSACSALNLGTAATLNNLDPLHDDIARMAFALDAPVNLLPMDNGIVFVMDAVTAEHGERHINAVLVRNDNFEAASSLAPPAANRTYHLFAIDQQDQEKIRELQQWARELEQTYGNAGGELNMTVRARFCRVRPTDVRQEKISVYVSVPGSPRLNPLLSNIGLADLAGQEPMQIPLCRQT